MIKAMFEDIHWSSADASVSGEKFFDSNGAQFFVKGVAYQLSESDPLIDTNQCQADAKMMSDLGANAIRVYHVGRCKLESHSRGWRAN